MWLTRNIWTSTTTQKPNKPKRKDKTHQEPNHTLQAVSIGTEKATIEDFKILQQKLENNRFTIKTIENHVERKKITTIDKLATLLNNVELFSNPKWIEEIKKSIKLLICAGFSKKEIKIKYKQEPETPE